MPQHSYTLYQCGCAGSAIKGNSYDDQNTFSTVFPPPSTWRLRLTIPRHTIRFITIGAYVRALYTHQCKFSPVPPPPPPPPSWKVSSEYSLPVPQDTLVIPAIRMAVIGRQLQSTPHGRQNTFSFIPRLPWRDFLENSHLPHEALHVKTKVNSHTRLYFGSQ